MAAAEVYNRECLGYIFGRKPTKRQNRFVVTSAITCAAVVRRTNAHVRQSERAFRRMNELMQAEPASFPWLGDFHSHPSRPYRLACDLSVEDLNSMAPDDYRFGILVSISRRGKRPLEWRLKSRRTRLRGTLGKFDFHLVAHQLIRDAAGTAIRDEHEAESPPPGHRGRQSNPEEPEPFRPPHVRRAVSLIHWCHGEGTAQAHRRSFL